MAVCKKIPLGDGAPLAVAPSASTPLARRKADAVLPGVSVNEMETNTEDNADIDLREVYFLIIHFLSGGPCHRTCGQLWDELLKHNLLPRRYHAWYSRTGMQSGHEDDDGSSLPLSYIQLAERYPHIRKDHLIKLLQQLLLKSYAFSVDMPFTKNPTAADVPTLLGLGDVSLLSSEKTKAGKQILRGKHYLTWPHLQANQVHGLTLREIGGGFAKHHRAPSIRAACFAIAKPSMMLDRIQIIKKLRGHRNSVYCAIFDRSGQYVITGSDDRLVKIWCLETGFCLSSCRGHEGDITDLAVSSNNALVASASNDFIVRVWRLPDGLPISVLQGHTGAVTAIAFSPRPGCEHHLLSSSDDGTCRIWDARDSHINPRVYVPKPKDTSTGAKANGGKINDPAQSVSQSGNRILCCAFNANGTIFVTGSSDRLARVWSACRRNGDITSQPNHELDALSGHENDVNYVQFSGSAVPARSFSADSVKEEHFLKFKNSWFTHDNIVTCSRDGSAIIWVPRSRRSHRRAAHWIRAYHLKVPPPPMSPQLPRGGPRQRLVPTPRGVNMIVWSLDNRFVLAAIMDCRICVWNAVNGSLVHSLTGHTKSTYVLDVHPFNPRIAMSAGYDGQAIIWDIWEGVPIRTYAIGDFNLVDGKFSPDGTSIVLSDEVGQIYILATGEGESQKDAKYDQFFLGDYRRLVQDAHGNVLDQETQLCPYQRNIQDLLCDASMIPYPDPYQSMYQQRRLGALGIDWQFHPPSVNLAVGTLDDNNYAIPEEQITQFQPAQSEGDRDRWLEQPAELEDGMDWEREIDAQSDETGSEYNGTDEYTSEDEQGSLSVSCSDESEEEENDRDEESSRTNLRRSKRKIPKAEGIMFTSAGRRVRKEADYGDASSARVKNHTKSRKSRLVPKTRTPSEKLVRPQRLAARNALNLFSHIDDSATEEEQELDERDSRASQSKADSLNNEPQNSSRSGKQKCCDDEEKSQDIEPMSKLSEHKESNRFGNSERKLVFKFKLRKLVIPESSKSDSEVQGKTVSPSGEVTLKGDEHERISLIFPDTASEARLTSEGQFNSVATIHRPENGEFDNHNDEENKDSERTGHSQKDHYDDPSSVYGEKEIRWGEVRTRTFKRLRVGDTTELDTNVRAKTRVGRSSAVQANAHDHTQPLGFVQPSLSGNNCLEEGKNTFEAERSETGEACCQNEIICAQPENSYHVRSFNQVEFSTKTNCVFRKRKSNAIAEHEGLPSKRTCMERTGNSPVDYSDSGLEENWITNHGYISEKSETSIPGECDDVRILDRRSEMDETVADNEEARNIRDKGCNYDEGIEMRQNTFGNLKLCRSRSTAQKSCYLPHEWKPVNDSEDGKFSEQDGSVQSCKPAEEIACGNVTDRDANASCHNLQDGDCNIGSKYLEYNSSYPDRENGLHALTLVKSGMQGGMKNVGHNKGNLLGANMHAGDNSAGVVQNSSNDKVSTFTVKLQPKSIEDGGRTRSKVIKTDKNVQEPGTSGNHFSVNDGYACEERQTRLGKHGSEAKGLIDSETKTVSRVSVTRHDRNKKGVDSNKERMQGENGQLNKNLSWLMLYEMEDGSRYIPQFGDEVAYLRQGHQEFLELSGSQEKGPWRTFRNSIQPVEFCRVVGLDYCTLAGSGDTCCKLTLKFIDQKSKVCGKTFRLTLPELTNFPDFIVERNRYDMAVNRNWTNRDKCRVWWRSEDGEGGSWWEGRVISVKPKSAEFPNSPWDRYIVQYKADPSGSHTHSPWELCELFDCDNSGWKLLHIDDQTKMKLLCSIKELEQGSYKNEDCYALERLRQISGKSDFRNRTPLPLTFEIIKLRLEKDYYRTLQAFKHDLNVIVMNVRSFFGKNTEMVVKLQKLTERLLQGLVNES